MIGRDDYVREMTIDYLVCVIWTGLDWDNMVDGNPTELDAYDVSDFTDFARDKAGDDCGTFYDANAADLADMNPEQAGHDFSLTRNGHGTGFWDRGLGDLGERLSDAARKFGEISVFVTDDGHLEFD